MGCDTIYINSLTHDCFERAEKEKPEMIKRVNNNKTTKTSDIKEHKSILSIILLLCFICVALFPFLMDRFIIGNNIPSNISNPDWVGFLGSYVSAIIGASISMLGIALTIRFTKRENDKERELQRLFDQRSQDKELHIMVSDLIYSLSTCGEAILIDADDPTNIADKKCPKFETANYELLKISRKLLAYSAMRANATGRPYLNFSETFSSIAEYSVNLIGICEQYFTDATECKDSDKLRTLKDYYAKQLEEARISVENALMDYSELIIK